MIYPNIAGITYESVVDGPGIRTAIFLSGCQHNCPGCHNKEAQNPNFGIQMDEDYVLDIAKKIVNRPYIAGITLTGGDPLFWPENTWNFLSTLLTYLLAWDSNWLVNRESPVWIYTGYVYEKIPMSNTMADILAQTNVIIDGPFIQGQADKRLAFRGSSNQRMIDVKASRKAGETILWRPKNA